MAKLILCFLILTTAIFAETSKKLVITPSGHAKNVTQIRAHFPTAAGALGETTAPLSMDCKAEGQGRWVTSQDWIFDFKEELPAGNRCQLTLVLKKDLSGNSIDAESSYSFHTGGPQIKSTQPYAGEYNSIDEDQLFTLRLDADVDEASLKGKLYFEVPQIANPISFKVLSLEEIAKANPSFAKEFKESKEPVLFVQAASKFPPDKEIRLIWSEGIKTKAGVPSVNRQVFAFKVRPAFVVTARCTRAAEGADCSPFDDVVLDFNASVAENAKVKIEGLAKDQVLDQKNSNYWVIAAPHKPGARYQVSFPDNFRDDADRPLSSNRELTIKVGIQSPLIKFDGRFGILESKAKTQLPVHLRRVENDTTVRMLKISDDPKEIVSWYRRNARVDHRQSIFDDSKQKTESIKLARSQGHDAFEVKGIPLPGPGYYQLEISSAELGKQYQMTPMYVYSQALVTDLAIHWKESKDNALVWITSLNSGLPVSAAKVKVYDCTLKEVASGNTKKDGSFFLKNALPRPNCSTAWHGGLKYGEGGFLITASFEDDRSFLFSSANDGIESWRFQLDSDRYEKAEMKAVLDRSLLRAGETISGINFARRRDLTGLLIPQAKSLDRNQLIVHLGSEKSYSQKLTWDAAGRSQWSWDIPKDANLGLYELRVGHQTLGRFSVREFKVATVKASLTAEEPKPVAARKLSYTFNVNYLNGGSAGDLPVALRAEIRDAYVSVEEFPDYSFNLGAPKEEDGDEEDQEQVAEAKIEIKAVSTKLDANGQAKASLDIPAFTVPKQLRAELEFPDTNGQLRTQSVSQTIQPSAILVGIKGIGSSPKPGTSQNFQSVLLDLDQKPLVSKIKVSRWKKTILSHRRRSIGGTYTYQHKVELSDETRICEGKSNADGRFDCLVHFPISSSYVVVAEAEDSKGRVMKTNTDVWVSGSQYWYEASDNDRIDLIADKKVYEAGDTAKVLVKAPFSKGTILFATEREGIERYEVKEFDSKNPYINLPITRAHAPNIYLSAWVVRGRVKGTEPFLKVDLGKPAFKLGITDLKVGRSKHKLSVDVKTDKKDYAPREKVKVSIDVKSPLGPLPEGSAVTLVAVDEGLLEIEDNQSWDLLENMMGHRGYTSEHASSSLFVVGKRHFGLKSVAAGGGGGRGNNRELFETLLKWSAIVPLIDGHAEVEVPLNDSLSGFRIVAIAHASSDLFGKGETTIHSSKDLSLFAGMPATARQGDRYRAEVTVRNASSEAMDVELSGSFGSNQALAQQKINLPAKSSKIAFWELQIPEGVKSLTYKFDAKAKGIEDSAVIVQTVYNPFPAQALLGQVQQIDAPLDLPLQLPVNGKNAFIQVQSQSKLSPKSLDAIRAYMSQYPYSCLEQRLSKAVSLEDRAAWDAVNISSYLDINGLAKFFPVLNEGSVDLTAYVLELSYYQGWAIKAEVKQKMLEALHNFVEGRVKLMGSGIFLHEKIRALSAISLWEEGAASTLDEMKVELNYLPFESLVDVYRIYAKSKNAEQVDLANKLMLERMEFRGSIMQVKDSGFSMLGSLDASLERLLLTQIQHKQDDTDIPQLFRSLLSSQKKGLWDSTVSNALGTVTFHKFSERFDRVAVEGDTVAAIDGESKPIKQDAAASRFDWKTDSKNLKLSHDGAGKPWVSVTAFASMPLTEAVGSGFQVEKKLSPIKQKKSGTNSVGDIFEVEIKFKTNTTQSWTAVNDPIPSGARILSVESGAVYTEPGFQGLKAYYESVSPGTMSLKYRFQLNTFGKFILPPTRVEALYAPEVFGALPNKDWVTE